MEDFFTEKTKEKMFLKVSLITVSIFTVASFIKQVFIPDIELPLVLGFVVALDFITGVVKSLSLDITSIKSSIAKNKGITVSWYFIIIICSGLCKYIALQKSHFTYECTVVLTDLTLIYLIWSEVLSVSENGIYTKGLPKPLYLIFKALHTLVSLQFIKGWFIKNLSDNYDKNKK